MTTPRGAWPVMLTPFHDDLSIDLEALEVRFGGRSVPFELDDEIRHRILNGLDDIALTLQQTEAIESYEADRERAGPVTTAL